MKKDNEWKMQQKELMFCLSKWLSEVEAYALAKSTRSPDKWYLYKVSENPAAKHLQDRESFVVVRAYREGETVRAGDGIFVETEFLLS
jgi:hypothetical protein